VRRVRGDVLADGAVCRVSAHPRSTPVLVGEAHRRAVDLELRPRLPARRASSPTRRAMPPLPLGELRLGERVAERESSARGACACERARRLGADAQRRRVGGAQLGCSRSIACSSRKSCRTPVGERGRSRT
jgi:hypothetical protein